MVRRSCSMRVLALLAVAAALAACSKHGAEDDLRPVHVAGVRIDPRTSSPVVDLIEDGDSGRALAIWIGEYEAESISNAIHHQPSPRPNPHDLLANTIAKVDGRVRRTLVNELRDRTYYAVIEVDLHGRTLAIDARPSDAIALALRTGAPVLVRESLLERGQEIPEDEGAVEIREPRGARESIETPRL